MREIVAQLRERDKKLAKVIDSYPLCTIGTNASRADNFESLVETVISQQLAIKAADTIYGRLKSLVGGVVTPQSISAVADTALREAGVSGAKVRTIRGLAESEIDFAKLHTLDDEQIRTSLTSLWGIGTWTVDMYMIFQLGRLDIWPVGDLGVRRGWEKIYSLSEEISPEELAKKGRKFAPYRSVVAWYCWRALTPPQ